MSLTMLRQVKMDEGTFQSTRPRGARHFDFEEIGRTLDVSIHAPTGGATAYIVSFRRSRKYIALNAKVEILLPCGTLFFCKMLKISFPKPLAFVHPLMFALFYIIRSPVTFKSVFFPNTSTLLRSSFPKW